MLHGRSGSRAAFRGCRAASPGVGPLSGDAVRQVREPDRVREMLRGKSGSRTASGRCCAANPEAGCRKWLTDVIFSGIYDTGITRYIPLLAVMQGGEWPLRNVRTFFH